mmetsp:Transcript_38237/g.101845  ORF Transcript_38237/g.101845 Transcript_38237/m.101845 type:complete len:259 (+) Transcript_38237:1401-2177(+)
MQVRVVLHIWRAHQPLPALANFVQVLAVAHWDGDILLAVDDEQGRTQQRYSVLIGKPVLDQVAQGPDDSVRQVPHRQERGDQNEPMDLVLDSDTQSRARADRPSQQEDAIQRPAQHLPDKSERRERVFRDRLLVGLTARADAIAGVFDGEHMHLELVPQDRAEVVTVPEILCVAVQIQDEEPRRRRQKKEARDAVLRCRRLRIHRLRHPNELVWEVIEGVRRLWGGKEDARDDVDVRVHLVWRDVLGIIGDTSSRITR